MLHLNRKNVKTLNESDKLLFLMKYVPKPTNFNKVKVYNLWTLRNFYQLYLFFIFYRHLKR